MNWKTLTSEAGVDEIITASYSKPQIIFKHSTRCMISSMVRSRLEKTAPPENADFYYLDLIANRSVSNYVAKAFSVQHESPQILVIKDGSCVYDESHNGISMQEIEEVTSA